MQLFLIRHAQSANNAQPDEHRVEDPPLTELGRRQATALAVWLETVGLDHVIASPFRRSLETAEYIRRRLAIKPHVWVDLHELGGCYAGHETERYEGRPGLSHSQIAAEFPGFQLDPAINGQGWWQCRPHESDEQARARATRLIEKTVSMFGATDQSVAYIMHADFKRIFLEELFASLEVPNLIWHSIYNTSVTVIGLGGSSPRLNIYNSTVHLSPDLLTL